MKAYIKFALGYLLTVPCCTGSTRLMNANSDVAFYLGAILLLATLSLVAITTTTLCNQIRTDLELHDIASKL